MLHIMIAEEEESIKQTWRPVVCTIVLKPTLTAFQSLHPHRTLYSFIINSCFMLVSQQGGTNSADPTPDMGYKQNEHWHQSSLEQYSLLPASTQFHVRYSAKHKLILFALLQGIRDVRLDKKM